jgi:hypothetical protein
MQVTHPIGVFEKTIQCNTMQYNTLFKVGKIQTTKTQALVLL